MSVFGDAELASRTAAQEQSIALGVAAENLLEKASKALADDDLAGARKFVRKAVALPFDEFDEQWPGWNMAHMLIFMALTDELEDADDDEDEAWLDAALAVAQQDLDTATLEGTGVASMRRALAVLCQDYELSPSQVRRIQAVVGGGPVEPERPPAPEPAHQLEGIIAMLKALQDYDEALDELLG